MGAVSRNTDGDIIYLMIKRLPQTISPPLSRNLDGQGVAGGGREGNKEATDSPVQYSAGETSAMHHVEFASSICR